MNDRIRKLALQAGYRPLPGFDFANSMEEVFITKFAELIVKECADVCQGFGESGDGYTCSYEILEHFGVEE